MNYDVIIIGAGIAGQLLAWFLAREHSTLRVALIADNRGHPPASLASTGIIGLFNTRLGVSPLGDKLWQAYHLAADFFKTHRPAGVEPAMDEGGRQVFWLIRPEVFLPWLARASSAAVFDLPVTRVCPGRVATRDGRHFYAPAIVVAAGAYMKVREDIYPQSKSIDQSSVVAGSFATFGGVDLGQCSWLARRGRANLIYRASDRSLLVGSTTNPGACPIADKAGLQELCRLFGQEFSLPHWSLATLRTGLRHKGAARQPFWAEISRGVYAVGGLYKSGYSLSFLAARELLVQLRV